MAPQTQTQRQNASKLAFKVHQQEPELVTPAKPTPREMKVLSLMDDQQGRLRFHVRLIYFYEFHKRSISDPVEVIRNALAETLVFYYPFAGRLREGPDQRLMVECNGQGVMFVKAHADVALSEFGDELVPPFPCSQELLFDVEGSTDILHSPLLLFQVTRLKCGAIILVIRLSHPMSDAVGFSLFTTALAEITRGAQAPSVLPVWDRHLLDGGVPARAVARARPGYHHTTEAEAERVVQRSFFFGTPEISAVRGLLPPDQREGATDFETLTLFLWRCRTAALRFEPSAETQVMCVVNARSKLKNPPLPPGYYGNAIVSPTAISTAKDLAERPLGFALRLVKEARSSVTEDYVRSMADFSATARNRPNPEAVTTFVVSDVTRMAHDNLDFGFGKPLYGGLAPAEARDIPGMCFYVACKNKKGEIGTLVLTGLPAPAMERFAKEVENVLHNHLYVSHQGTEIPKCVIKSTL